MPFSSVALHPLGSFHSLHVVNLIAFVLPADWFHGDIYSITIENVNKLMGFKCHACRLRAVPVCPYAQADMVLKDQSDREDDVDMSIEDENHNCPKDLCTSDGPKELQDQIIEGELHGHSIDKQVGDLEVLEDCKDPKEPDSHSTEKQLDDCNWLKEPDSCNKIEELDSHSTEKGPHDHLNELDNHWGENKRVDCNFLSEPGYHNNVKDLDNGDGPEDLVTNEDSGNFATGKIDSLLELNNQKSLKDPDNSNITEELDNQNSLDKLDGQNSLMKPDNHNSMEELDNHNYQKEFGYQNSPNGLDNHKELHSAQNGKCTAVTYTDGVLVEQFNTSLSSKEAMIMTTTDDSVKESIALQSKGSPEDTVLPAEHEVNLQMPLSLLTL
jgi:hypothetical protein